MAFQINRATYVDIKDADNANLEQVMQSSNVLIIQIIPHH